MENKKLVYAKVVEEKFNDRVLSVSKSQIYYDEMPEAVCLVVAKNYDDFYNIVKNAVSYGVTTFYVDKSLFSKNEAVYWSRYDQKVKPTDEIDYEIATYYEPMSSYSFTTLADQLPADQFADWCKDAGIFAAKAVKAAAKKASE